MEQMVQLLKEAQEEKRRAEAERDRARDQAEKVHYPPSKRLIGKTSLPKKIWLDWRERTSRKTGSSARNSMS